MPAPPVNRSNPTATSRTNSALGLSKGSASPDIGFDVDIDFAPEAVENGHRDVVMLADAELVEDNASPPPVPPTTVPLLAALSVDLASSLAASSAGHQRADWRHFLGAFDGRKAEPTALRVGKKLWIAALAVAIGAAAWAVGRNAGPWASKSAAGATARSASTAPMRSAPIETARSGELAMNPTVQAVAPGSSIFAAAARDAIGSSPGDVGSGPKASAQRAGQPPDESPRAGSPRPTSNDGAGQPSTAPAPRHVPAAHAATAAPPIPAPPENVSPEPPTIAPPPDNPGSAAFGEVDVAPAFDQSVAMQALREAGDAARSCRSGDTPSGAVRLSVTFARTGRVAQANIEDASLAATPVGSCIVSRFRAVAVPPFRGSSMTVRKTLNF
jgi:hypothetical protein